MLKVITDIPYTVDNGDMSMFALSAVSDTIDDGMILALIHRRSVKFKLEVLVVVLRLTIGYVNPLTPSVIIWLSLPMFSAIKAERQSARMSEINIGRLNLSGKVLASVGL